jgi:hypothetical protein
MIPAPCVFFTLALRFEVDGKPCTITASSRTGICSKMHVDRRAVGAVVVPVGLAFHAPNAIFNTSLKRVVIYRLTNNFGAFR